MVVLWAGCSEIIRIFVSNGVFVSMRIADDEYGRLKVFYRVQVTGKRGFVFCKKVDENKGRLWKHVITIVCTGITICYEC